jgi:hypothetical protein
MFKGSFSDSLSESFDVVSFIEESDVFNSEFIHKIGLSTGHQTASINTASGRPDLISKSVLRANYSYHGLMMIMNRRSSSEYVKGGTVNIPTTTQIAKVVGDMENG